MRAAIAAVLQTAAFVLAPIGAFVVFGAGVGILALAGCAFALGWFVEHA